ncbi:Hsp70 family protein [Streptomyces sp. NPDC046909]|uniref:Hsp70 family protein n=1 Tax=Streptomyces sp. NPDC046909 TaxID=3155617 RepID=UPI0033D056F8
MPVLAVAYGIDLGTSNSSIMVSRGDGTLVPVTDPVSGQVAVPTSVCVGPEGKLLVGAAAENGKRLRPTEYRSEFKRDIGEDAPSPLGGRSYTPLELAAEVLRFLREQAERTVYGKPGRVVMTVPVTWAQTRRNELMAAAAQAGFNVRKIVLETEPEAAIRAAFEGAIEGPGTVLVHDLGGGTFDCAVARRAADDSFTILGSRGLDNIGGTDFTRGVLALLRAKFPDRTAQLLDGPAHMADTLRRRIQLFDTCETIKIRLSVRRTYEDLVPELVPPVELTLPRAEFEDLVRPLVQRTVDSCEAMLRDAGLSWADVDRVIPVGGASRMPLVGALLAKRSGSVVQRLDEPELAVVRGAVLSARGRLEQEEAKRRAKAEAKAKAERERQAKKAADAERRRREQAAREQREKKAAELARETVKKAKKEEEKASTTTHSVSSPSTSSSSTTSSSSSSSTPPGELVGGGCLGALAGAVLSGFAGAVFGGPSEGLIAFFVIAGAVIGAFNASR